MSRVIWQLAGAVFFTVGLVCMPGEWWMKALIWIGIGMCTGKIEMRRR